MPVTSEILEKAMSQAAAEGRKWMGATSPNPPVGAVALDVAGRVIAMAAHHRAGEMHAEALLISNCQKNGLIHLIDTLCVTLETCNHHGRTPPCTEAIIRSGIKNIVIGTRDPNRKVQGGGIEALQKAGIQVTVNVAEEECHQLIHAFSYFAQTGKPWITVKRALDRNGSMIPPHGQKTFTSPESLRLAHRLRKKSDAIITGSGTILADNSLFTVRHVPDHVNKRRYLAILDRRGRVPAEYMRTAVERGFDVMICQNIDTALKDLVLKGARDILVEAGPTLTQTILGSGNWTQSVTIRQADSDRVETIFNTDQQMPFDPKQFCWDYFLPQE